ncbi:hypothetical protein [Roseivirga pacifica]|uniref:hypothetical protein n=1 Tax=Roseivirga pacifica TaxID=1267423 RepID=UPI00209563D1|nr:hypothetical protein [Roseivirga pacifica]MCO6357723.1 hypothetical protein [Roseivirga pacifica]MCO6365976.1 hypothetical protein [Roseivirga pacifica]MCO6371304.1 hypothetical protein [Roseivirga pacifica]MCO6375525.1 hypothetical protein [Roseivirga pacifica]MCO6378682.1 hypothetical protein [Roseivirga pacifica]
MKNYYLTFAFTLLCFSCSDNSQQARVEKLKNINEHLITEIEHLNLLSDSLKKEYNNLEDLLDSTKNKLLQYEKDRNYLEFAKLGEYQSYDSKEGNKADGFNYRIEVYGSEIYRYFYISKIEHTGEVRRQQILKNEINIETLLGIYSEQSGNVKFQSWNSPNTFSLTHLDTTYNLTITLTGEVKLQ